MTVPKHNPTPYMRVGNFLIVNPNGGHVADCWSDDTADFIVTACNAHEALLEFAKSVVTPTEGQFVRVGVLKMGVAAIEQAQPK